jgi:uncharacterized protein YjbI with pentapeptide repeats
MKIFKFHDKQLVFSDDSPDIRDTIRAAISQGVRLNDCDFTRCDLSGADFSGGDFTLSNFWMSNLSGCNISNCNFGSAYLVAANMAAITALDARFVGAMLNSTKLDKGDFTGADFDMASILGASLGTGKNMAKTDGAKNIAISLSNWDIVDKLKRY